MSMWKQEELLAAHQIGAGQNGRGPEPQPRATPETLGELVEAADPIASAALVLATIALAFALYLYWSGGHGR